LLIISLILISYHHFGTEAKM